MKKITNKTLLKCEDKTYQPIEIDGVIYWETGEPPTFDDVHNSKPCYYIFERNIIKREYSHHVESSTIIAQSQPKLEGIPVINLDDYVERLAIENYPFAVGGIGNSENDKKNHFIIGYKSNPNQYTQNDIEKAIEKCIDIQTNGHQIRLNTILKEINSISVIEVDAFFCIKNYF